MLNRQPNQNQRKNSGSVTDKPEPFHLLFLKYISVSINVTEVYDSSKDAEFKIENNVINFFFEKIIFFEFSAKKN